MCAEGREDVQREVEEGARIRTFSFCSAPRLRCPAPRQSLFPCSNSIHTVPSSSTHLAACFWSSGATLAWHLHACLVFCAFCFGQFSHLLDQSKPGFVYLLWPPPLCNCHPPSAVVYQCLALTLTIADIGPGLGTSFSFPIAILPTYGGTWVLLPSQAYSPPPRPSSSLVYFYPTANTLHTLHGICIKELLRPLSLFRLPYLHPVFYF